ncbi:MAG TPA: hypothetical protein VK177_13205 [Flavobacteriales bacterium]|nr:hypothetical protein [Flavobacteriales bacterium]
MANHTYLISEVQFFIDKDDPKNSEFIKGTGIDLSKPCTSTMPTITDIRKTIAEFGLPLKEIRVLENRFELTAGTDEENALCLIFTNYTDEDTPVPMFQVERGSSPDLVIDVAKFLSLSYGKFLLYCDAGVMSLVNPEKDKKSIFEEMGWTI